MTATVEEKSSDEPLAAGLTFPDGFVWGTATAAYQIEGAAHEDGRGQSIWDTFSRTPGKVHAGHTGDVACDHYHRYTDDVKLMAQLGLGAYRFSVAWSRIQPDGTGPVNPRGLDFYDRLTDELLANGVKPVLTLYHWDLPQNLQDRGGWTVRETAEAYAEYAKIVHARLGDRIDLWTTFNEPFCSAFLGYGNGLHAPGIQDPAASLIAAHHLLLGHGLAARALKEAGAEQVSITINPAAVEPLDPANPADVDAARIVDAVSNRIFFEPIFRGSYADDTRAVIDRFTGQKHIREGDEALINAPIDVLGINYYTPTYVSAAPGTPASLDTPGSEGIAFRKPVGPVTDIGWQIEPAMLTRLLVRIHEEYGTPMMITENGAAYSTGPGADNEINDADRIEYIDSHLRACLDAISSGVDLRGYFAWSLMDNFEWAYGYDQRFGLVHVDYNTQQRTVKESGKWYSGVVKRNGLLGK